LQSLLLRQYYNFGVDKDNVTVENPEPTNSSVVNDAGANNVPLETQSTLVPFMDKHNFTALPQWKFEDLYRLDPQFKPSVSSLQWTTVVT